MTIKEIYSYENISARSFNICQDNDLMDLNSIIMYFVENENFFKLRNCGKKVNRELTELCLKYIEIEKISNNHAVQKGNSIFSIITNLSINQKEIIDIYIENKHNNLSNRTKNSLKNFLFGELTIRNFCEKFFLNDNSKLPYIRNMGIKSGVELISFVDSLRNFIEGVFLIRDENDINRIKNVLLINNDIVSLDLINEIVRKHTIFKLTDFLINKNILFNKKLNLIFFKSINIYQEQPKYRLDEIAKQFQMSKGRIRELQNICIEELYKKIHIIAAANDENLTTNYGVDFNEYFICIDTELNNRINEINQTCFSKEFCAFLLLVKLHDEYKLIGNIEDILKIGKYRKSNHHKWKNFYLIKTEIYNEFDFNLFLEDFFERINERIVEDYIFNFHGYLSNFFKKNNIDILTPVSQIAENIINNEYGIYLDIDDNIIFRRNLKKQSYEYAYEALERIGRPAKVNEIYEKIKELNPNYDTDVNKVRNMMKREFGFVPLGRESVFGLKIWEREIQNFKGGSIRSIVYEYLASKSEPQHISKITSFVLQYRNKSNEKSILQNLKLDKTRSFNFFTDSFIGLSNKLYENIDIKLIDNNAVERFTWDERYSQLIEFINNYKRLPLIINGSSEIKLYRWYKHQIRMIKKGEIDEKKSILINEIYEILENNYVL